MRPSRRRGRIGGLRGQVFAGLMLSLLGALLLVSLATSQLHKRQLQQAVADEARRHVAWLSALPEPYREPALTALSTNPEILFAGPADELPAEAPETAALALRPFDVHPAIWALGRPEEGPEFWVVLSLTDAQQAVTDSRRAQLLYLSLTLFFVLLVGYAFFSYVVIRPLRALSVATSRAAEGDLASPVAVIPRNEFGDLARQFNEMLRRLEEQRQELQTQLEELRLTQDTLIRSEKLAGVGQLAAGVAHEVGNPLSAVMGYTELLEDRSLDEATAADLADRILTQLRRIREIIRQLLDYSREDARQQPGPVDLKATVHEAAQLVQATTPGSGLQVEIDVDETLRARAVPGELSQALVNLLLNASRAMAEHAVDEPAVQVRAHAEDTIVILTVADEGPGVDPEVADKIFDPFFTTRQPGEGTGLGLAITHRIIERAGGEIRLLAPGESGGATFEIRLPRATRHTPNRRDRR